MKVSTKSTDHYVISRVEGSLSIENLNTFEEEMIKNLALGKDLIVDLFAVTFICSSALSFFLSFSKKIQTARLNFIIVGLNEDIGRLFSITDLNKYFKIFNTTEEAIKFLKDQRS